MDLAEVSMAMLEGDSLPHPSLQNIIHNTSLKWVFVGGKGGVGKTTSSCSLAVQMAAVRTSVLLLSTDPAHNISDAFDQKFSSAPVLVKGFSNLFAMEIDPATGLAGLSDDVWSTEGNYGFRKIIGKLLSVVPGIDELMSYSEVLKLIDSMNFSVVVFDTAPTGHTLRFLSFPSTMEESMSKLMDYKNLLAPMVSQMSSTLGLGNMNVDEVGEQLQSRLPIIQRVNAEFKNASLCTFICVCIPEFLSLYETERLIQELAKLDIDTRNIIVNQLLFLPQGKQDNCGMCSARHRIQSKYLSQIEELYEDFHITKLPLLEREIRGVKLLNFFSQYLVTPYDPTTSPSVNSVL